MKTVKIELLTDQNELKSYLNEVDRDFETPLSNKTDIATFSTKIIDNGKVYAVKENNKISAIICFYCNDYIENKAHLPILSTKKEARGKGYARLLINEMTKLCKEKEMKYIYCDSVNPIAISLYKSLGFIEYKKEKNKSYLKLNL